MANANETPTRDCTFKDAEMLIGGSTIIDAAIARKDALQKKRSNWTDDFLNSLKKRIDDAAKKHLGADSAKALRQSTKDLKDLMAPVQSPSLSLKRR